MGTDIGALVALNAVFRQPFGHVNGHAALFIGRDAQGEYGGGMEGGNGQIVALLRQDGPDHFADVGRFAATATIMAVSAAETTARTAASSVEAP